MLVKVYHLGPIPTVLKYISSHMAHYKSRTHGDGVGTDRDENGS
jgi:hypothetical protein